LKASIFLNGDKLLLSGSGSQPRSSPKNATFHPVLVHTP
jgi:hypothetical protein